MKVGDTVLIESHNKLEKLVISRETKDYWVVVKGDWERKFRKSSGSIAGNNSPFDYQHITEFDPVKWAAYVAKTNKQYYLNLITRLSNAKVDWKRLKEIYEELIGDKDGD